MRGVKARDEIKSYSLCRCGEICRKCGTRYQNFEAVNHVMTTDTEFFYKYKTLQKYIQVRMNCRLPVL